ncbi:MAG: hypothetical protein ABR555_01520 [Pyrinomonadaceae bacterium]
MDVNEPVRRRIVIDLDSISAAAATTARPGPATVKRKRWPSILAVICILCLLSALAAAGGGYWFWRHYQSTPAYSIALILDAAQQNNFNAVSERLDQNAIANNVFSRIEEKALSRYGNALTKDTRQLVDSFLPTLLPEVQKTSERELLEEIKTLSKQSEAKPFVVIALTTPSVAKIVTESDTAKVSATLDKRDFVFSMHRDGDRWKVVDVEDEALLQRIVDGLMKDLPAIGELDVLKKTKSIVKRKRR